MTVKPIRLSRWQRRERYEAWFRAECAAGRPPDKLFHGGHLIRRAA